MDDEPMPRIVYYNNINPKANKIIQDKSVGDKSKKAGKKNKKNVIEEKKEEKKSDKKVNKNEDKIRKVEYPQLSL